MHQVISKLKNSDTTLIVCLGQIQPFKVVSIDNDTLALKIRYISLKAYIYII